MFSVCLTIFFYGRVKRFPSFEKLFSGLDCSKVLKLVFEKGLLFSVLKEDLLDEFSFQMLFEKVLGVKEDKKGSELVELDEFQD